MKLFFVQLPEQRPFDYLPPLHPPLLAGAAIAWLTRVGAVTRDDCAILDLVTAEYGGDAAIQSAVVAARPDLVIFTLYDYNLDRSIHIAKALRALLPAACFAAAGPEIQPGQPVYKAHAFDACVEDEAWTGPYANGPAFEALVEDVKARTVQPRYRGGASDEWWARVPPAQLDPYLAGVIAAGPERPVFIGRLPYGVTNAAAKDEYLLNIAPLVANLASNRNAVEILLGDPGPLSPEERSRFVKSLAAANYRGLSVLAYGDAQAIDEQTAQLWMDASLVALRSPLLSTNPATLKALGHGLDKAVFESGANLLEAHGAVVKPLVYLGLPHDSYETVIETFDFLGMAGIGQDAELKPLPLKPGTPYRAKATELGILEHLAKPPYFVLETDLMREEDMLDAVADFEESFDVAVYPPIRPFFKESWKGFCSCIDARKPGALDAALVNPDKLAQSMTILADPDDGEGIRRLLAAAPELRRHNPFTLWQLVLASGNSLPKPALQRKLVDAFSMPEHYFESAHLYSLDPQVSYQARLFFATGSESLALHAMHADREIETIFALGSSMPGKRLLEALPFLAFDRDSVPFDLLYDVMGYYRNYPDMLIEAPRGLLAR